MNAKAEAAYHPYPVGVRVFETLEQGSDEWLSHRCGIVTASVVGQLITTKTIKPASNDYSRALTNHLVAERLTGHVEEVFPSRAMERGTLDEPYARAAYEAHTGVTVKEVGFIIREDIGYRLGYSPDGLVGADGLIEIKSRAQKIQLKTILADEVPAENMAQIQTGLLVTGRDYLDYVSYCGGMPLYVKRVLPDPRWFEAIKDAVALFEANAAEMIETYDRNRQGFPLTDRINHYEEMSF